MASIVVREIAAPEGYVMDDAYNYYSHFGYLRDLSPVVFTDVDSNAFRYEVFEIETLSSTSVAEMTGGDWDLTLFTCTIGGKKRIIVRCTLTEE